MSLLDLLLFRPADPTAEWARTNHPLPPVRMWPFAIGPLGLGDPLSAAEFLGRPEKCERFRKSSYVRLIYARRGLVLEFSENELVEVLFHIGDGVFSAPTKDSVYCRPQLEGGGELSDATTIDEAKRLLGEPHETDVDEDDGEVVLKYVDGDVLQELEFNSQGKVGAWVAMF